MAHKLLGIVTAFAARKLILDCLIYNEPSTLTQSIDDGLRSIT